MKPTFAVPVGLTLCLPWLPLSAAAVSRAESQEQVSAGSGLPWILILAVAAAGVILAVVLATRHSKPASPVGMPPQMPPIPPAPPAKSPATLEAVGTFLGGKHFGISSRAVIGRGMDADICVREAVVGRAHCQVCWQEGALYVTDLGSANGTTVEGVGLLMPNTPTRLRDGDVFWLGREQYAFRVRIRRSAGSM